MEYKDLVTYRQYEYRGMKIIVEINRIKKTASFVDYKNKQTFKIGEKSFEFKAKDWKFAERELKYMNGWILILQGMINVIEEVKKELEGFDTEDTEQLLKIMLELDKVKGGK